MSTMGCAIFSWKFVRCLVCLGAAGVIFGCLLSAVLTYAAVYDGGAPGWAGPKSMAMRHIGPAGGAQDTPVFFFNLDCTAVSYRMTGSGDMRTGCFTPTAFGMLDSDDNIAIFNGTDEGLPLIPYTAHQILAPWPKAMNLVALNPIATGGAQIGLYTGPLGSLHDQRDLSGRLEAKQLAGPPDIVLKDTAGKPLVVNPQTLAFSEGGSWMAAETLSGSFVRINLASLQIKAFAPAYGSQGSPALLKSRVAVSGDGRFIAVANDVAAQFKVYDLAACHGQVPNLPPKDIPPENCDSYDYWPFAASRIPGLRSVRKVRFLNDGLLGLTAYSTGGSAGDLYELAPYDRISALTDYIGLGDSYTSGEGAFDYLAGTTGPYNNCHLSANSYPLLIARDLFGQSGGHSVACSGAVIRDVGDSSDGYRGQVKGVPDLKDLERSEPSLLESVETGFMPGFIAQQRFISRWQPAIATVSIGGNDVGFGDLLKNCVEPHPTLERGGNDCYGTYEDRLELTGLVDRTVPRWTSLYRQLIEEAPGVRLYVIGYPQIAVDGGDCADNVRLSRQELELSISFINYIDNSMKEAADAAGATYVDISQALKGHRLCEAAGYDVAMNGLTAGDDTGPGGMGVLGKESYHPNALGQSLIEQAILRQTHNLGGPVGESGSGQPGGTGKAEMLDAPRTGRAINVLVPDDNLTSGAGYLGSTISLHASGASDGLKPSSSYSISLDGPAGTPLGTAVSDGSGDVTASVSLPDSTLPGGHTIDLGDENEAGAPVDVTQPFYVDSGLDVSGLSAAGFTQGAGPEQYYVGAARTGRVRGSVLGLMSSGDHGQSNGQAGNGSRLDIAASLRPLAVGKNHGTARGPALLIAVPAILVLIMLLATKINKRRGFWVQ